MTFPFFFISFPSAFWFKCIVKVKDSYFWRDKLVASFPTLPIFSYWRVVLQKWCSSSLIYGAELILFGLAEWDHCVQMAKGHLFDENVGVWL